MNPHNNAYPVNTTGQDVTYAEMGLTKRELFAAMALQGLVGSDTVGSSGDYAKVAVQLADALVEELSQPWPFSPSSPHRTCSSL